MCNFYNLLQFISINNKLILKNLLHTLDFIHLILRLNALEMIS